MVFAYHDNIKFKVVMRVVNFAEPKSFPLFGKVSAFTLISQIHKSSGTAL
jgi:hypothetical protein